MQKNGFTLIEIMVAVAIVGMLAAIAYPSYTEFVYRGARAEAMSALVEIANRQEQHFADNHVYTNSLSNLGVTSTTETGLYTIAVTSDGTVFTVTATPLKAPATSDVKCTQLSIDDLGQKQSLGPGGYAFCWGR